MNLNLFRRNVVAMLKKLLSAFLVMGILAQYSSVLFAGMDRVLQEKYRRRFENKALFLRIPIRAEKHVIYVGERGLDAERRPGNLFRFKVGDQVRVYNISFGGEEIKFKIGSLDATKQSDVIFKFPTSLQESFPEQVFDLTLANTFTEGLSYTDIDEAKQKFLGDQFDKMVSDLAATSNTSREFVMQALVEKVPAFASGKRELRNLEAKNGELQQQLGQLNSRIRNLELEQKQLHAENTRLRSQAEAIRSELNSSDTTSDPAVDIRRLK